MITKKMNDALNAQINWEFWSGYLYLSVAQHFESVGLKGIANWFSIQYKEELDHALIFINYVNARGGRVTLAPIAEVPQSWESPLDAYKFTLEHEQKVTALINNLYQLAEDEKDFATRQMLNWFVAEQVEEEDTARELIDKFTLIGNDGMGIYQLDSELGSRTYTQASPLANKD
ncbi:MAG: ferritin [Muribaculaceae bacterium]|nr:ferritin [Bacteroidales bacterium]MBD5304517.1 ferritin [Bacteroides sp.]MBD5340730.1 ferritin [Bacteroides sp.]MDE6072106.1 ferritin [Muribaculaceae bacterium]